MATKKEIGDWAEKLVCRECKCPKCKQKKTLKRLINNFRCADIICDFCGYLGQVKAKKENTTSTIPNEILGAAWAPQEKMIDAGIYIPLFFVPYTDALKDSKASIFYLPVDYQEKKMFVPRKPLSATAQRAGWQGFKYDLTVIDKSLMAKLY
jgi:type II restriction enzyme